MANLDLWMDGDWGDESWAWQQEIVVDVPRLQEDRWYAAAVDRHIRLALEHLAKEVEEIGVRFPQVRRT